MTTCFLPLLSGNSSQFLSKRHQMNMDEFGVIATAEQ